MLSDSIILIRHLFLRSQYIINNAAERPLKLTTLVTSTTDGLVNPHISLYTETGVFVTDVEPLNPKKALLTYLRLPPGKYVIVVTGEATSPARGYYSFTVTLN